MNKKLLTKIIFPAFVALFSAGLLVASPAPVHALTNEEGGVTIYKKALLNGLNTCYRPYNHRPDYFYYMEKQVTTRQFSTLNWENATFTRYGSRDDSILVPTNLIGSNVVSGQLSCKEAFEALGTVYGKTPSNPEDIGYFEDASGETGDKNNCFSIKHKTNTTSTIGADVYETNQICFDVSDGAITYEIAGNATFKEPQGEKSKNISVILNGQENVSIYVRDNDGNETYSTDVSVAEGTKWTDFIRNLETEAITMNQLPNNNNRLTFLADVHIEETTTGDKTYVRNTLSASESTNSSALKAMRYYSGNDHMGWGAINFTRRNRFDLGMLYINKFLEDENIALRYDDNNCGGDEDKTELKKTTGYIYHKSSEKWCVLEGVDSVKNIEVNMISGSHEMKRTSMKDVIEQMQSDDYNGLGQGDGNAPGAGDNGDTDGITPNCWNAASSLGWFLCPAIQVLGNLTTSIYDSVIKSSFLSIDGGTLLSTNASDNDSLYRSWDTFREYANIFFVILLTIVILSQFTGKGIDNYGIKKILPRLIVMVILVNVSFVICQLAVDLSNILGHGLQNLFEDFAEKVEIVTKDGSNVDAHLGSFLGTLLGTSEGALFGNIITGGGAILGGVIIASTWESWIIPFALFLLGCVIGVIFFMIILGVREAGIIILVAMTPVAIICYALPNTKKLFDKWFKLFVSLLMVFPIAGALMGGGYWASKLMLATAVNGGGFFYALVAMLLQVVPFFFIPTLVKSSLVAAGAIGAKIASMGSSLSKSAKKGLANSDGIKDAQRRLGVHNAERRFNRLTAGGGLRNRIAGRVGENTRLGRAMRSSVDRSRARYGSAVREEQIRDAKARAGMLLPTAEELSAVTSAEEARQLNERTANREAGYTSDTVFMNSMKAQQDAFSAAFNALEVDPENHDNIANFRALQNVLGKTDAGIGILENEYNRRLMAEQTRARNAGDNATVSAGMSLAAGYLMGDHGAFKGSNRSFYDLAKDLTNGNEVFRHGAFTEHDNGAGNPATYYNDYYTNKAAKDGKLTGASFNALGETELSRIATAATDGTLSHKALTEYARLAEEAFADPHTQVNAENAKHFNAIREALYNNNQASYEAAHKNNFFDQKGREFVHTNGNDYTYTDENGTTTHYSRNNNGDMVGGGETVKVMDATQKYKHDNGSFKNLINGEELKVDHAPQGPHKVDLPQGWIRDPNGQWLDMSGGGLGRPLNTAEIKKAEQIEQHNIQVEINQAANS